MQKLTRECRRFAASARGVVAVEFAMVMPFLLIVLLATIDAGRAIAIYMKVRSATYTLAAITNQYQSMQTADLQAVTGATSAVLAPYPSGPAVVTVTQIKIDSKNNTTVSWSYSLNGTARTQGSSIPVSSKILSAVGSPPAGSYSYLILSEVSYTYTPMFGYFITGTLPLSDNLYVRPRSNQCVWYSQATPTPVTSC
jgi:Flp pilus assembly protein TadG